MDPSLRPHHLDLPVGESRPVCHPPKLMLAQTSVTVLISEKFVIPLLASVMDF